MDEELKSLQLDIPGVGKSKEELKLHALSDEYDSRPIEKALLLLKKGDDIQKLCVIQSVPNLLQMDYKNTVQQVLPRIEQELPSATQEFNFAASRLYRDLSDQRMPLLDTILMGTESKDTMICSAWFDTLLHIIPALSDKQVKRKILPLALEKAQVNNGIRWRVVSCAILGLVAAHPSVTPMEVKTNILPMVHSLCQDFSQEVRAAMSAQLHYIASGLGENLVKSNLLPGLVELVSDENLTVRNAAIGTVVHIVPALNRSTKLEIIVPLFKQLCEKSMSKGDTTYLTISKDYGRLLSSLRGEISHADSTWFLKFYKTLSTKNPMPPQITTNHAAQCRENCAFNMPAITYFVMATMPDQIEFWLGTFTALVNDSYFAVRKTIASGLHEITRLLGSQCAVIRQHVIVLLKDDTEEVLDALLGHLRQILELLCKYNSLSKKSVTPYTAELTKALFKCQSKLSAGCNWRLQTVFIEQMEYVVECMQSEYIHQNFTPFLIKLLMTARPQPVRTQLTRTILIILRYNSKEVQRQYIRHSLVTNLCCSTSCYTRIVFIKMCLHAMDIFSNLYFKKYFYEYYVRLLSDPISNVRLCAVQNLHALSKMLIMPNDKPLKTMLDTTVLRMESTETDKDVKSILHVQLAAMRTITVPSLEYISRERKKQDEEAALVPKAKSVAPQTAPPLSSASTSTKDSQPSSGKSSTPTTQSSQRPATSTTGGRPTTNVGKSQTVEDSYELKLEVCKQIYPQYNTAKNSINSVVCSNNVIVPDNINSFTNNTKSDNNTATSDISISSRNNTICPNFDQTENVQIATTTSANITDDMKVSLIMESIENNKPQNQCKIPTVNNLKKRLSVSLPMKHFEEKIERAKSGGNRKSTNRWSLCYIIGDNNNNNNNNSSSTINNSKIPILKLQKSKSIEDGIDTEMNLDKDNNQLSCENYPVRDTILFRSRHSNLPVLKK